jgi:hypothetical protein
VISSTKSRFFEKPGRKKDPIQILENSNVSSFVWLCVGILSGSQYNPRCKGQVTFYLSAIMTRNILDSKREAVAVEIVAPDAMQGHNEKNREGDKTAVLLSRFLFR